MRYKGNIHRLYIMLSAEGLANIEIIDKIVENMKDVNITKEEVIEALKSRGLL